MAKGGWSYSYAQLVPHTDLYANWVADLTKISDAIIALGNGWTQDFITRYYTNGQNGVWVCSWTNSTGAKLLMDARMVYSFSYPAIQATNNLANRTETAINSQLNIGFAYWPPGNSGAGSANPGLANYVPKDGFRFGYTGYDEPIYALRWDYLYDGNNVAFVFHFIGKDDDLFILLENQSQSSRGFDHFWAMGTLIGTLAHPSAETDSNRAKECCLGALNGMGGLVSADSPVSFWRTPTQDGGTPPTSAARIRDDGAFLTWAGTGIVTTVHDFNTLGTEPWVSPVLYYSRASDIDAEGIIRGNGMKGVLDSDKIRVVQGNLLSQRQTLDGGNFIYIGGNVAIGWDPANGAMF